MKVKAERRLRKTREVTIDEIFRKRVVRDTKEVGPRGGCRKAELRRIGNANVESYG